MHDTEKCRVFQEMLSVEIPVSQERKQESGYVFKGFCIVPQRASDSCVFVSLRKGYRPARHAPFFDISCRRQAGVQ
jgi:hypothetical protein